MKNYIFKVMLNDQQISGCFWPGESAIHAFEEALEKGALHIPPGEESTVLATTEQGICIRFNVSAGC